MLISLVDREQAVAMPRQLYNPPALYLFAGVEMGNEYPISSVGASLLLSSILPTTENT